MNNIKIVKTIVNFGADLYCVVIFCEIKYKSFPDIV